jgi:hypothetical protein
VIAHQALSLIWDVLARDSTTGCGAMSWLVNEEEAHPRMEVEPVMAIPIFDQSLA